MQLTEAMLVNVLADEQCGKPDIRCCEQPEEVFSLLLSTEFDLVLTDLQMPAMNGIELLRRIRSLEHPQGRTIPVVAITARGDMSEADFRVKGFAGMLQKPFNRQDLLSMLGRVFAGEESGGHVSAPQGESFGESPETGRFNFAPLTAFSENDPQAALEIMHTFVKETERSIRLLEQAVHEKDMKQVCAIAHKMLPTFIMIEAKEAVPALQWLENRRGETEYTPEADKAVRLVIRQAGAVVAEAGKLTMRDV